MNKRNKGFTLAELLIVVAIIAVLVGIAIPIFTTQLEKAREATDLANIRSAYAEVMTEAITDEANDHIKTVPLKQKVNGWVKGSTAGATLSSLGKVDGTPTSGGKCKVEWKKDDDNQYKCFFTFDGESSGGGESGKPGEIGPDGKVIFPKQEDYTDINVYYDDFAKSYAKLVENFLSENKINKDKISYGEEELYNSKKIGMIGNYNGKTDVSGIAESLKYPGDVVNELKGNGRSTDKYYVFVDENYQVLGYSFEYSKLRENTISKYDTYCNVYDSDGKIIKTLGSKHSSNEEKQIIADKYWPQN